MVIVMIIIHKNGKIAVGIEALRATWAKIHNHNTWKRRPFWNPRWQPL